MNVLPKRFQEDKFFRDMKISTEEWKTLKLDLMKDRQRRNAERFKYITGWYTYHKSKEYLEAVGSKNIKWFKDNCRCFFNTRIECPACQMLRLFKEN